MNENDHPEISHLETRKAKKISATQKAIILASTRYSCQTLENLMDLMLLSGSKTMSLKYLKRQLSLLTQDRYLQYNPAKNLVQSTPKGKKFLASLLDRWISEDQREKNILTKGGKDIEQIAPLCAMVDTAFLKPAPGGIGYGGYFASFHQMGDPAEPVPRISLEDGMVIDPDAVLAFQRGEIYGIHSVFMIKAISSRLLSERISSGLKQILSGLASSAISLATLEKWKKAWEREVRFQGSMILADKSIYKDEILSFLSGCPGFACVSSFEELRNLSGWGEVWHSLSQKKTVKFSDLWSEPEK